MADKSVETLATVYNKIFSDYSALESLTREMAKELLLHAVGIDPSDGSALCFGCKEEGSVTSTPEIQHEPDCIVGKAEAWLRDNPLSGAGKDGK